jgi:ABC-2 type transport system permease protein
MIGSGALLTAAYVRHYGSAIPAGKTAFDPAAYSLSGFLLAQLAIGLPGVVVITSEYATGSIRSTFAAPRNEVPCSPPRRRSLAPSPPLAGITSSFAAFFTGQAILPGEDPETRIGSPGVIRSAIGTGLYLAVLGLLALGWHLIRCTAGAIAALTGLVLILPVLVQGLSASWQAHITTYLPSVAGQAIIGRTKFAAAGRLLFP